MAIGDKTSQNKQRLHKAMPLQNHYIFNHTLKQPANNTKRRPKPPFDTLPVAAESSRFFHMRFFVVMLLGMLLGCLGFLRGRSGSRFLGVLLVMVLLGVMLLGMRRSGSLGGRS